MTIHWKADEQYFTVVLCALNFPLIVILVNLSILDLALSGIKGLSIISSLIYIVVCNGCIESGQ